MGFRSHLCSMPYTYAQAQRLRLHLYFDVLHRGLRGPSDPLCVRGMIVQRKDRPVPRSVRGTFRDCPAPAPDEASSPLFEIVLLSSPVYPMNPVLELGLITLAEHCRMHKIPIVMA